MKRPLLIGLLCLGTTAALAHSGVNNAAVLARMESMKRTGDAMKVLGDMAKGTTAFDSVAARTAADKIAVEAGRTADLFELPEMDPKSEALPAIWQTFDDFTAKATTLEDTARGLSTSLTSAEDLGPALASLGGTCKTCHTAYRE